LTYGAGEGPSIPVTSYAAALEALRSSQVIRPFDEASLPFRGATALGLDGPAHTARRRTLNTLLRRDGHSWFRERVLFPTVEANLAPVLAQVLAAPVGEPARVDLIAFGMRVFLQLAAAMAGLTAARTPERAAELLEILGHVQEALGVHLYPPGEQAELTARGLVAKEALRDRFYAPALAEHGELVARVEAGELDAGELPHDLLSLVAAHADPAFADVDLGLREVIQTLVAGTETSVTTLAHAVHDLRDWFDVHPGDYPLRTDPAFLVGAVNETLRLHPVTPVLPRIAIADLELPGGERVPAGSRLAVDPVAANSDPAAFGPDAHVYDPRRQVPRGVYAYGLAFGSGPHMCWGLQLVLGNTGTDGSLVHVLERLYRARMEPDPDLLPRRERGLRDTYASYPVVFRAEGEP